MRMTPGSDMECLPSSRQVEGTRLAKPVIDRSGQDRPGVHRPGDRREEKAIHARNACRVPTRGYILVALCAPASPLSSVKGGKR
jgi:hypothetical protein